MLTTLGLALMLGLSANPTAATDTDKPVGYSVTRFETSTGLPHNHVKTIAQDQDGFIWIGTWDGLSRYDGHEFRNYYHKPNDSTSIPYFTIDRVLVDRHNDIWVSGYPYATAQYDRANDNFIRLSDENTAHLLLDFQGDIWVQTPTHIKKWNHDTRTFTYYELSYGGQPDSIARGVLFVTEMDHKGRFWMFFSNPSGQWLVYRSEAMTHDKVEIRYFGGFPNSYMQPEYSGNIHRFIPLESAQGNMWLLTGYGVLRYDGLTRQFHPWRDEFPAGELQGIDPEYVQRFRQGLKYYNPSRLELPTVDDSRVAFVSAHMVDRQGNLWLGYYDENDMAAGVARMVPTPSWFRHYLTPEALGGTQEAFFPVLVDKEGTLWATSRNANRIYKVGKDGIVRTDQPLDNRLWLRNVHARSLLEDETGIWIGYSSFYLVRHDFATGRYTLVMDTSGEPVQDDRLPSGVVHLAREGDHLYIFSYLAIYRYHIPTGTLTQLTRPDYTKAIYSMQKDGDRGWIVGYAKGTVREFDNDFNIKGEYVIGSALFNVESVCRGDSNTIWAAMLGEGVARIDTRTGQSELLTTADGLSNNTTYSLVKDRMGNLWISTNQGISRYNPETRQFRQFGPNDGLRIGEFNSEGSFVSATGEVYFAGMGGVVSFSPDSIALSRDQLPLSPLLITEVSVSGIPRHFGKPVYKADTLTLNKGDDNFSLGFASLDFRDAPRIRYRYRLVGEQEEFTETDHRNRFVSYANLDPGHYPFELQATDNEGNWVSERRVMVVIPPLYYQTGWFRGLVIVAALSLAFLLAFTYIRQMQLRFRQKQGQLRLESLRGQMNPHFIFNTLNSINYFISQNDRLSANRYIADFSRLMRTILGNMSADYIPFAREHESLRDYLQLEHLRFSDKFDYTIEVQEGLIDEGVEVFPGMVQPFVENAIWHGARGLEGRKGMVAVRFYRDGTGLKCDVTDDGIGRKLSQARKSNLHVHNSRGIHIVQERLDILNSLRQTDYRITIGDLFPDREETGTLVTIDIPFKP